MPTPMPGAGLLRAIQSDLPAERDATLARIAEIATEGAELREHLDRLNAILRAAEVSGDGVAT